MNEADSLRAEHGQIGRLARALGHIVMRPLPPRPAELARIRHEFTHGLRRHLQREDMIVYPRLLRSADAAVRNTAKRLVAESGVLAERFDAYCARWGGPAIAADWPGYRLATSELLALLGSRMAAEEYELYPLLEAEEAPRGAARWCGLPGVGPMRLRLITVPAGRY